MISHTELRKGVRIILDGQPYEILESRPLKVAQRKAVIQTKIRNLLNGNVFDKNFHQGDVFEEAEVLKFEAKFLYSHKDKFFLSKASDPSRRFDLSREQIGSGAQFLKSNQIVDALEFENKVVSVVLPIKIQLKVIEAPPGVKAERAQPGTKIVILETGAKINAPLFVEQGDIIELNTETGEYTRRIE